MKTVEELETISTREELVQVLKQLSADYINNRKSLENDTLPSFLSALAGWVEDMDGFYLNRGLPVPTAPEWKTFAYMLMGARCYE